MFRGRPGGRRYVWSGSRVRDALFTSVRSRHPDTSTGCSKKTDPLVYFDDNLGKYGLILTIFSLLQQDIHDTQKLSYFSHLTFIMLPLYLSKQTLMLVSMRIFLDHAAKQISMYSNG